MVPKHELFVPLNMYCQVFADAIEATNGPVSSGIGCRGVDYSTSSSEVLVHAIALEYNGLRQDDALAAGVIILPPLFSFNCLESCK